MYVLMAHMVEMFYIWSAQRWGARRWNMGWQRTLTRVNRAGGGRNVNRTKSERYSETAEEGRLGRCNVWRGNQSIHVSGFKKITRTNCELNVALLWGHFKLDPLILLWLYFDLIGRYHSIFLFIYIVKFLLEILGWYFEHYQYTLKSNPSEVRKLDEQPSRRIFDKVG